MKNKNATVHICMISDDNYVMPTCVAIQSFIQSRKEGHFHIHIVASSLSQATEQQFKQLESEDVSIDIVRENAEERFKGFHKFDKNAVCVASISALLKFLIPEMFPDIDKMLYLDGDLIAKADLGEIYNYDVEDYYAAAVIDSGSIYYKHQYVKKVKNYFNSGVMLLNLKKLREEHVSDLLLETKKNMQDASLMDQNVFNLVFDGKVLLLPIRYNFMPVSLERAYEKWTINDVNKTYGTDYKNKKQLFADAAVIHYSSKDKPWKVLDGACASDWIHYYLKTPIPHPLVTLDNSRRETYGISVIMPCYNVEDYVGESLESVLKQSFQDFEIICLDDGSTDNTLKILREFEAKYKQIKVIANENHRQGYERNVGIRNAKGKYLYYMDSDDLLDTTCFEKIFACAEENKLDLLYFEGTSFYEQPELEIKHPEYMRAYNRREAFPRVYGGNELYVKFREKGGLIVSPCLQLVRKDYILNNYLFFPELPMLEDNLYTFWTLIKADRVKCIEDILFYRRVRGNSTMTASRNLERVEALVVIIKELIIEMSKYEKGSPMYLAIANHLQRYYINLSDMFKVLNNSCHEPWKELSGYEKMEGYEKEWLLSSLYAESMELKMQQLRKELSDNKIQRKRQSNEIDKLKKQVKELEKKLKKKK